MNILITGGAGFIGSHLCELFFSASKQDTKVRVFCLDNFNNFYDPQVKRENIAGLLKKDRFTLFEEDITNRAGLRDLFENYSFDMIVHLASMAGVRGSIENALLYNHINIQGTHELLDLACKYEVKYFIFGSSSSVYGGNKKVPFSELDRVDSPSSPYGWTKRAGELLCYNYHHLYRVSIVSLRFFTVYGPRQRPDLAIHKFSRLIQEGKVISVYGDGGSRRDYTYVEDTVEGIFKTIDYLLNQKEAIYRIFNLGKGHMVELKDLICCIEKYLGKKARVESLGMQPGDMEVTYADIDRAQKELGYRARVGIQEGIERFMDWFKMC